MNIRKVSFVENFDHDGVTSKWNFLKKWKRSHLRWILFGLLLICCKKKYEKIYIWSLPNIDSLCDSLRLVDFGRDLYNDKIYKILCYILAQYRDRSERFWKWCFFGFLNFFEIFFFFNKKGTHPKSRSVLKKK